MKVALLQRTREEWTAKQAVDDIERQIRGEGFAPAPVEVSRPQHPAQKRMMAALTAPAEPTVEGQYKRRNNAIRAVIEFCYVEEAHTRSRTMVVEVSSTKAGRTEDPRRDSPLDAAAISVFVSKPSERPRRCFVCVGKAMTLVPGDPDVERLICEFYSSSDLTRHVRRRHLANMNDGDKSQCQVCCMPLKHKMHFKNHALQIHGTVSGD
jgi:hypothetical protein